MTSTDRLAELAAEIDRLRGRILELEATHAMLLGKFRAAVLDEPDGPATITHNIPASAPPHDE